MNWKFTVHDQWSEIWSNTNVDQWIKFLDSSIDAHVFFHPLLVKVWIDTYLPLRKLNPIFIWGEADSGNKVFFPLVQWNKNWKGAFIKTIVPVGYSDYDYHDPIFLNIPESKEIKSFWEDIQLYLCQYNVNEIVLNGIHDRYLTDTKQWTKDDICPFLSLENMHCNNDLMNFFKTSLRGDIRRQIRRLGELGTLYLKEYGTYSELEDTFHLFLSEHKLKWPNAYKAPSFHQRLVSDNLLGKIVHFSSLNINDTPIAWHLGFDYRGTYYYYMPISNHQYAVYSPVKIHLYYLIDRAIRLEYKKYDHLRGEENYKAGWSNGNETLFSFVKESADMISKLKVFSYKKKIQLLR